ncbi:protein prune homolog 2 isoform X2 [Parasteatoda tepidariorum]|uniref:protein prune homolog 2 isoform X2 n=1 Tax=Parasteatoda tepidariorum TaxID=114398 RepID=UPI00077F88B9|nr:protein prune homolog 2 isoform X2 [Parasteatoda tepidariorum]
MLPNKNNLNKPLSVPDENNSNEIIDYHLETVDFPDSPNHHSLLEIKELEVNNEQYEEVGQESFNSLGRRKINVTQSPLPEKPILSDGDKMCDEIDEQDIDIDSMSMDGSRKKIAISPAILEDDQRSLSSLSSRSNNDFYSPSDDVILDEDERETLDEIDGFSDSSFGSDRIPEMSAAEELEEERSWKSCVVNGEDRKIDMKVIEPYRKVLSHGGYEESSCNAIILFSACHLPERSRKDYNYVMDNLFLYVVVTLDELIAEDYVLIYLHGATDSNNMPSFSWLKRCYQMIDRRLRKNLKKLYLVHPTFWLKTLVLMTRPFISAKFSRKLKFVYSLKELSTYVTLQHASIPDKVKIFDFERIFPGCANECRSMYSVVYKAYVESLTIH